MGEGETCTAGLTGLGTLAAQSLGPFDADFIEAAALMRSHGAKPVTSGRPFGPSLPGLVAAFPTAVVEVGALPQQERRG